MKRIVFMGTPEFAVPSLKALFEKGYEIPLVVTQPDKPAGRGKKLTPPPVKVEAKKLGIPITQPGKIKDNEEFKELIKAVSPDLIVVVAYGKILPSWLLELPKFGCINLHASLLPEYRGASPIQAALLDGKKETGVTVMKVTEELDAGDILAQEKVAIEEEDNAKTLHDKLSKVGAKLLAKTVPLLFEGKITPVPQDSSKATYCPKITKEMGRIDWREPAEVINNKIRAFTPWPSAYTFFEGKRFQITKAKPVSCDSKFPPGTIVKADKELVVKTGKGCLKVLKMKPEGKREMKVEEILKGYRFKVGNSFQ